MFRQWGWASIGTTKLVRHFGFQQYLADLFDTKVTLGKPVFEYDSERAFNGDGYSISVHELPASVRSRFESADEGLLREFPQRPHYRGHWKSQPWRKAPFDPSLSKYLDFALMERSVAKERELEVHFTEIRKALSRNGSYYAFFYSDHPDYPGNVDFFVVDLVGGRLYVINHNT